MAQLDVNQRTSIAQPCSRSLFDLQAFDSSHGTARTANALADPDDLVIENPAMWFQDLPNIRMRPREMTQALPEEMRELAPEWMKEANGVVLGRLALVTPADYSSADAIVYPVGSPSTGALFYDLDGDCQVDEMMIADARQRTGSVHLNANHREASSSEFSSGFVGDAVSYEDGNMDGQDDTCLRLGETDPGKRMSVGIDSQGHPTTVRGVKRYVELAGAQVEVTVVNGV